MEIAHRWSDRNLTKIELIMSLLILSLLIGIFSQYMYSIFSKAEESMIRRTVLNVNTALFHRASMMVMQGKFDELELLLKINPMKELQSNLNINEIINDIELNSSTLSESIVTTPSNYGGEIVSEYIDIMEKGYWYFVIDDNVLIYLFKNTGPFNYTKKGSSILQFQIKLDYKDINLNGRFDESVDEYKTVKLKLTDGMESIQGI